MSTLSADNYTGQSATHTLKLAGTTFVGADSDGVLTITGEGGSTKTNVQQGLIKFWLNLDGQSTISTRDSFNISGVVDEGEGQYTPSYSNSMGNANYSMGCNTDYDGIEYSINCKIIATGFPFLVIFFA